MGRAIEGECAWVFDDLLEWSENFDMSVPLGSLAATLFVNTGDPGSRMMAMFTAYFDASGTQEQKFVVVAGHIANYYQWRFFEKSWEGTHHEFGVDLPFHMAEFVAARNNPEKYAKQSHARKDYVELAKDRKRADQFFGKLSSPQVLAVNCAISTAVPMSIYNEISSLLDLRTIVPPYALGARIALECVRKWEKEFDISEPVECIFEEGDFEQGKFTQLMVDEGQGVPIYKKKREFAGLQAADHLAWEEHYYQKQRLSGAGDVRNTLRFTLYSIPKIRREVTRAGLIRLCEVKGIDPRTGVKK